jgi:hypothetical protein
MGLRPEHRVARKWALSKPMSSKLYEAGRAGCICLFYNQSLLLECCADSSAAPNTIDVQRVVGLVNFGTWLATNGPA